MPVLLHSCFCLIFYLLCYKLTEEAHRPRRRHPLGVWSPHICFTVCPDDLATTFLLFLPYTSCSTTAPATAASPRAWTAASQCDRVSKSVGINPITPITPCSSCINARPTQYKYPYLYLTFSRLTPCSAQVLRKKQAAEGSVVVPHAHSHCRTHLPCQTSQLKLPCHDLQTHYLPRHWLHLVYLSEQDGRIIYWTCKKDIVKYNLQNIFSEKKLRNNLERK